LCQPGGLRSLPVRPAGRRTPLRGHAERDLAALGNRLRATRAVRRGQRIRATASPGKPLRSGKRTFLGGNAKMHGAGKGGPAGSTRRSTALSRRRSWARARATGSWAPEAPTPRHRKGRPSRGKRRPEERGGSAPVDGDGRGLPGLPMLRVVRVTERLQGAQLQPVVTVAHL